MLHRRGSTAAALLATAALVLSASACAKEDRTTEVFTPITTLPAEEAVRDSVEEVAPWSQASVEERSIEAAGLRRSFIVSLPGGARERQRLPLIFVFHGYNEDAQSIRNYSGLDHADAIVVYMQGENKAWAPAPYAVTSGAQDLAFVDAVREQLSAEFSVDRARVFAAGLSNGGGFAAFVGCQRPQDFTAVGTVSAAFYAKVSEGCSAIPIKHVDFHGTDDSVITYGGGERHNTVYDSTEAMLQEAAARNRCQAVPVETRLSPTVVEERWLRCDAGLEHYRIEGGKHVWSGGSTDKSGTTSEGFTTRHMLEFFGVPYR